MALLLQLNAELPERFPNHDRRIYVFACRRNTCRRKDGSIRAIRGVRIWKEDESKIETEKPAQEEVKPEPEKPKPELGSALFGSSSFGAGSSGANPFSSNANPFSSSSGPTQSNPNPFSSQPAAKPASPEPEQKLAKSFAETLSINAPKATPPPPPEPWPVEDKQPKPYPLLYLADADYETLEPTPAEVPSNARIEDADASEPSALDREAFESSMDATFQKFADRLSQNPEQCIRYEFGGTPLIYSKTDKVGELLNRGGIPRCPNCGDRRVFEVQLTPNAIAELEADDLSLEGMEWGTIIVGVCSSDCLQRGQGVGETGYLEEWTGVQWEELAKNN